MIKSKNIYLIITAVLALIISVGIFTIIGIFYDKKTDSPIIPEEPVMEDIRVVFSCDEELYEDTVLDDLKNYLSVFAVMSDETETSITDYSLSGTIIAGDCSITVSYMDFSDTFTVTIEVELIPIDPPIIEQGIWGSYLCAFYEPQEVYLVLRDDYTYILVENDTQIGSGEVFPDSDNSVIIELGENSVYISLDFESESADYTDITKNNDKIAEYTYVENNGEEDDNIFTLKIYEGNIFKIEKRIETEQSIDSTIYGSYYYTDSSIIKLKYLDKSLDIVINSSESKYLPYDLAYETKELGDFTMTESTNDFDIEYTLSLLPDKNYILNIAYYVDGNYVNAAAERGVYKLDGDKLVIPYWEDAKIILEDDTFIVCYTYYYQSIKESAMYQLKLYDDGGTDYEFLLEKIATELSYHGYIEKTELEDITILTSDSEDEIGVYLVDNTTFILVDDYEGSYSLDNDIHNYNLSLQRDGSFTITVDGIPSSGKFEFIYDYISLGDSLYVNINSEDSFELIGDIKINIDCNIATVYMVDGQLDLNNIYLSISTLFGGNYSVPVLREYITHFSTEEEGVFIAEINYQNWKYEFVYNVVAEEIPISIKVYNLPETVSLGETLNIDLLYMEVISNIGNITLVETVSSEWIEGYSSAQAGDYYLIVTYNGMNYYHDYSVLVRIEEIGINLGYIVNEYFVHDEVELESAYINIVYNNGHIAQEPISLAMLKGFSTEEEGVYIGTIEYLGLSCYFEYTVRNVVEPEEISLDQTITFYTTDTSNYEYMPKVSFTPEEDGTYLIKSIGELDTYGYLYDSEGGLLLTNDDNGLDINFGINYEMSAGVTYIIAARLFNTPIGSFDIIIERYVAPIEPDVAGTYSLEGEADFDTLILNSDNTFIAINYEVTKYVGTYYADSDYYILVSESPEKQITVELGDGVFTVISNISY